MMLGKSDNRFLASYILLTVIQIVICNYMFLGPVVIVSVLPAAVMFWPLRSRTETAMIAAFCTGLAVDWLCDGVLGLNAAALVPVALVQKPLVRLYIGEDAIARQEKLSVKKTGWPKILAVCSSALALYLAIYIFLDGAGTRTFLFNLMRFAFSTAASLPVSALTVYALTNQDRGGRTYDF